MDRIGIISAMKIEIERIHEFMEVVDKIVVAGNEYFLGSIFGKEVVLVCGGVGKVNAASTTQILISVFDVDCVINTGIAGSMKDDVKICDVVISTDVSHHDVNERQLKNCYPNEQFFIADEKLLNVAKNIAEKIIDNGNNYHIGRIFSGESFIDDTSKKEDIINRLAPYCVEMESSAIGYVSHMNKTPFLIIRSISDNANEEAEISYETFEKKAAYQSANLLLDIIKNMWKIVNL